MVAGRNDSRRPGGVWNHEMDGPGSARRRGRPEHAGMADQDRRDRDSSGDLRINDVSPEIPQYGTGGGGNPCPGYVPGGDAADVRAALRVHVADDLYRARPGSVGGASDY